MVVTDHLQKHKNRHQVFVEPEGLYTNEMYVGGMSSSLPEDVQHAMYRSVPGLENVKIVDLSKLPEDASETLRIVRIGDYDACACIGAHVKNTAEIGTFKIISHSYDDGVWRLRWKVIV